jgi:Sec-independent protein translocase protein TatA
MDFLGIGLPELLFLLLLILLVFGPKDIARSARTLGHWLNRLSRSENYKIIRKTSEELRNLPERLAREAQLEEELQQLRALDADVKNTTIGRPGAEKPYQAWTQPLPPRPTEPADKTESQNPPVP